MHVNGKVNRMFTELTQATMANQQYGGPTENFTHCGASGAPGDRPFVQIWMECAPGKREEGRVGGEGESAVIVRAAYRSNSCPSSMAAGAMAARVLTGLTVENALLLTGEDLLRILGCPPRSIQLSNRMKYFNYFRDSIRYLASIASF